MAHILSTALWLAELTNTGLWLAESVPFMGPWLHATDSGQMFGYISNYLCLSLIFESQYYYLYPVTIVTQLPG